MKSRWFWAGQRKAFEDDSYGSLLCSKAMLGNCSGWLQTPCLCKPPTLFWIRVFIVPCGMETMSSQFTRAWPQTDVFISHSLPRSQTAPQHGAISPQHSQNSPVGAAEHPWGQGQQKPIWKKPKPQGKRSMVGKNVKKAQMTGALWSWSWGRVKHWNAQSSWALGRGLRPEPHLQTALGVAGTCYWSQLIDLCQPHRALMCTWMQVCTNHRDVVMDIWATAGELEFSRLSGTNDGT